MFEEEKIINDAYINSRSEGGGGGGEMKGLLLERVIFSLLIRGGEVRGERMDLQNFARVFSVCNFVAKLQYFFCLFLCVFYR